MLKTTLSRIHAISLIAVIVAAGASIAINSAKMKAETAMIVRAEASPQSIFWINQDHCVLRMVDTTGQVQDLWAAADVCLGGGVSICGHAGDASASKIPECETPLINQVRNSK